MRHAPKKLEAALSRLDQTIERRDPRAVEILSYHAAIEQQMDAELELLLLNGGHLATKLGFGQKIDVLLAATDNPFMPDLALALVAFNNLRNCVAHGQPTHIIDAHMTKLGRELRRTFRDDDEELPVHLAAAMMVASLASINDTDVMFALMGAS